MTDKTRADKTGTDKRDKKDRPAKGKAQSAKPPVSPQPRQVLGSVPAGPVDTELEQASTAHPVVQPASEPVKGLGGLRKPESTGESTGGSTGEAKPSTSTPTPHTEAAPRRYGPPATQPHTGDDTLVLPQGGLVALRRSGGLRFTSREVIVYHDGRVEVEGGTALDSGPASQAHKMSDRELAALYRALDGANFPRLGTTYGRQNPDAYAYEIVTRIGPATYSVEAFDGSIPAQLAPLIQLLTGYMRQTT